VFGALLHRVINFRLIRDKRLRFLVVRSGSYTE
jgi:hypothetical protein